MKKYLLLVGCIAILATGCGNNQMKSNDNSNSIDKMLENLAVLDLNNDIDKTTEAVNELYKKNIVINRTTKIDIQDAIRKYINDTYNINTVNESKCVFIEYSINGKNKQYNYCN